MALKHNFQSTFADGADPDQVQPSHWNEAHVIDSDGITIPAHSTVPSAPAADNVTIFCKEKANRALPAFVGPSGLDSSLQPFLATNKMGLWMPPGNATGVPGVFGMAAPSSTGTVTARNVATTNILTRAKRLGYVSAATAGSLAAQYGGAAQFTTGTGTGLGGFHVVIRFGVSDAAAVSGARMFVGVSSTTAAPTNIEPNTMTNSVGIAQLSTDATQWYLVYGGSAAQTAIALGTTLGAPTLTNTLWELALFSPPGSNGVVHYQVTNLGSGVTVTGTLTPTTPGTQTPANTTLMVQRIFRTNNATALAVAFDVSSIYIETDN